jgi:16S rRNA (guanine527-N7)-methyltransferase
MNLGASDDLLTEVLDRARSFGFLGPGTVDHHITHALGFLPHLTSGATVADLGSGGGLPGLVVAVRRPDLRLTLVELRQGRADFLLRAVRRLDVADRCAVLCSSVVDVAHEASFRGLFGAVTSRSFGPLQWTLECAAGLLMPGGVAIASVGPRVAEVELDELGLIEVGCTDGFRAFRRVGDPRADVPRHSRRPR